MAEITASQVKALRDKTGAGMMDCKSALAETGGDMEAAVDWLRAKGLSKAAKKAGRVAAEGLVAVAGGGTAQAAVVEVNAETDFVARNETFQELVSSVAKIALSVDGNDQALRKATYPGTSNTVEDHIRETVAQIGENLALRRAAGLKVERGVVSSYVHGAVVPDMGRIGVLVALQSDADQAKLDGFGRQLAMHVAASTPLAVDVSDLDPALIERERSILREQASGSGKPEEIIEKMIEGRLRKYYEEAVLLKQTFVIDGDQTVEQAIEAASKELGAPIRVTGFERFALGEGIEKDESDFAAEVAAAAGG